MKRRYSFFLFVTFLATVLVMSLSGCGNEAPTAENIDIKTQEDTPVEIILAGIDADGDELEFIIESEPNNGSLSGTKPMLIYTPNANYNGSDSFSYIVSDGQTNSLPAAVSIDVTPFNDPPTANDDEVVIEEDTSVVTIRVLDNDNDIDRDSLTILAVENSTNGFAAIDSASNLSYKPNKDFHGTDSLTYTVSDGRGGTSTAKVTIEVTPVNDAPYITSNPTDIVSVWSKYIYDVNATDPDIGDVLLYTLSLAPEGMTIDAGTGLIEWTPTSEQVETKNVQIEVTDNNDIPAVSVQSFTVRVLSLDSPLKVILTAQADQKEKVQASDDEFCEVTAGAYLSFDFADASIPQGGKIASAVFFVEHYENDFFSTGTLKWNVGTGWPVNTDIWATIEAPVRNGRDEKTVDIWDITTFANGPEEIDSLQLNINNDDRAGSKSFLDHIYLVVEWY